MSAKRRTLLDSLERPPWWIEPAALFSLALLATVAALGLTPNEGGWVDLAGNKLGGTCAFLEATGHPCPQCGMTRSFVWGIRGRWAEAFSFSPGGFTLLLWLEVAGLLSAVRLWTRDPNRWRIPYPIAVAWAAVWVVLLYLTPFVGRWLGWIPGP